MSSTAPTTSVESGTIHADPEGNLCFVLGPKADPDITPLMVELLKAANDCGREITLPFPGVVGEHFTVHPGADLDRAVGLYRQRVLEHRVNE